MTTEEAINFAKCLKNNWTIDFNDMADFCDMAIKALQEPEIVRCGECMLNTINTDGATDPWCYKFGYAVEDTDFCSYGERIE